MRTILTILFLAVTGVYAQEAQLRNAISALEKDDQFTHAIISLYVMDADGKQVFAHNERTGLVPASSLKVLTAISAYDMLGRDFRWKTLLGYTGKKNDDSIDGDLVIKGGGDPTLGSWRYKGGMEAAFQDMLAPYKNVKNVSGRLFIDDMIYGYQPVPDTWIWQDMGNYFGAGAFGFNWYENKYDLFLKPGRLNEPVTVIRTSPLDVAGQVTSMITTGPSGSGDKALIFASPYNEHIYATGTVGGGVAEFRISGAIPDPARAFGRYFIKRSKIKFGEGLVTASSYPERNILQERITWTDSIVSPPLDMVMKEFLNESINLYGEAFVKAIGAGSSDDPNTTITGFEAIRAYWKQKGIGEGMKNFDGSGLSVSNRIPVKTLASLLHYARKQPWFSSFYKAMPEMNGMVMKSGYIGGVRAYAGYARSKSGKEYSFAFIINNFDGSPGMVRQKMWKVLDLLK